MLALVLFAASAQGTVLIVTNTTEAFSGASTFVSGEQPIMLLPASNTTALLPGSATISNITISISSSSGIPIDFSKEGISVSTTGSLLSSTLVGGVITIVTPNSLTASAALSANLGVLKTLSYYNMIEPAQPIPKTVLITIVDSNGIQSANSISVNILAANASATNCTQRAVDFVLILDASSVNATLAWQNITFMATSIIQKLPLGATTIRFDENLHHSAF